MMPEAVKKMIILNDRLSDSNRRISDLEYKLVSVQECLLRYVNINEGLLDIVEQLSLRVRKLEAK